MGFEEDMVERALLDCGLVFEVGYCFANSIAGHREKVAETDLSVLQCLVQQCRFEEILIDRFLLRGLRGPTKVE